MLAYGTPEQIKKVANIIVSGGFGAFALTEPEAGSDAANMKTTAIKNGDNYVLNGSKCFISNGSIADIYIEFAMTDKNAGTKEISAFIVEKSRPGVTAGKEENKMGLRLSNTASVFFDDVKIPQDNLIGKEGKGFSIAMKTLDVERALTAALILGIAHRALDDGLIFYRLKLSE